MLAQVRWLLKINIMLLSSKQLSSLVFTSNIFLQIIGNDYISGC